MSNFLKNVISVMLVFIFLAAVFAAPVMWMWDYVVPSLFVGMHEITFWQAMWGTLLIRLLLTDSGIISALK